LEKPNEVAVYASDHVSIGQKLAAQLSEEIAKGKFKPGDRLPPERELALQLGVSRTAIRDAIKLLAGQGILKVTHGSGIYVANQDRITGQIANLLTVREGSLRELFEVRKLIEVEAAGWAAERGQPQGFDKIKKIVEQANQALHDPASLARLDAAFHLAVIEAGGNTILLRVMLNLLDLLADARKESLSIPGRPARSAGEHNDLAHAILSNDPAGARRLMLRHLTSVEESIMNGLQALRRPTPAESEVAVSQAIPVSLAEKLNGNSHKI